MSVKNKTSRNAFIVYLAIIICFVGIRVMSAFGLLSFMGKFGQYVFNIVVQIGLLFCGSIFLFSGIQKQKVKKTFTFYGYKKISLKAVLITIAIGVIVYFLNIFVASFFNYIIALFGYKFQQGTMPTSYPIYMLFVNLIFTAVLPAVCEETAHRGMLMKANSSLGYKKAILISALLFGLLHLNIEQFFYATIIGLFVGYLSVICDSIYPAMIIHFMNNALSVYMGFAAYYKLPFSRIFSGLTAFMNNNFVLGFVFILLLLSILIWLLMILVKKLFMETTGRTMANLQAELYRELARRDFMQEIEKSKAEVSGKDLMENVNTINLEQILIDKNIKLGLMTELDRDLMADTGQKYKLDAISITLMVTCFILTAGITLFTFIWGVL